MRFLTLVAYIACTCMTLQQQGALDWLYKAIVYRFYCVLFHLGCSSSMISWDTQYYYKIAQCHAWSYHTLTCVVQVVQASHSWMYLYAKPNVPKTHKAINLSTCKYLQCNCIRWKWRQFMIAIRLEHFQALQAHNSVSTNCIKVLTGIFVYTIGWICGCAHTYLLGYGHFSIVIRIAELLHTQCCQCIWCALWNVLLWTMHPAWRGSHSSYIL